MSATDPPLCRLCGKPHSSREPHILPANAKGEVRSNTRREGRDVLKGVKPTSTASTEKPNPPPATQNTGKRASRAAKPSPGKRKPRAKIIATHTPPPPYEVTK